MRVITLLLPILLLGQFVFSQTITGIIRDDLGKPLTSATLLIRKKADSSIVKSAISGTEGKYEFRDISTGVYFLQCSHVGYADRFVPIELKDEQTINVPVITLQKATGNLHEVVVTSRKPIVEVRSDKTILNVEGSINAIGSDALELLRKSPGVMVDKDNSISLSGKNGVKVYVDSRQVPLNGNDLSDYLKTIQSSNIESIEIISNPSAKYDASGNAGIINIRLRKNKSYGTNGSVTGGYNHGAYPKYNAGLSLNHRNGNINLFGNYNYDNSINRTYLNLYREQLDTLFNNRSIIKYASQSHTFKAGLDYTLNKRNTLGIMVNGSLTDFTANTSSSTPISYIPTGKVDRILVANNSIRAKRNNATLNANYRYADSLGRELTMDGDYGIYRISSNQLQPNLYFDPSGGALMYSNIFNMLAPTDIDIYSFKTDYEQNFKKGRLGFGAKISYVTSGNDFQQYNVLPNGKLYDTLHSNNFNYKENINAAYVNYNKNLKGWVVQAGLRVEDTYAKGTSTGYKNGSGYYTNYDSSFTRRYTDLFPSASVTFNKHMMKQWTLSYSRRIDRPAYQDLNPFEFKLDEYTYQKGNTDLRPQYTNSVGLTFMYKFKLVTTLNYSHVKDVFTQLSDTTDKSKAFLTKQNLATQDITSLNISYPFQRKWYGLFANLNAYYSLFKANFGVGRTIDLDVYAVNIYLQQSFKMSKGWTGELTGFYTSPSLWQGTFKTKSMGSVDAGIQKTLMKNKMTVKVSVSDIFNTNHWSSTSNFAGQKIFGNGGYESRQLKLYLTYKFGNSEVKMARQHKGGSEEERKRVNAQGGLGNYRRELHELI